jgi:hypothetical protein
MTEPVGSRQEDGTRTGKIHGAVLAGALALSAAPIVAYAGLLFGVSSNLPYLDDYDVILRFLNDSHAARSAGEQLSLLFAQHVEHRMAFLRALALASQHLQGGVDFDLLNKLGSLGLLALTFLLYAAVQRDGASHAERIVTFTPVPLVLIHPQFWDCLLWPTSSLANFWVVAFALASLLLVVRSGPAALLGAIGFAGLATFSQGNGMLVWGLGALALGSERRLRELAVFAGVGAAVLAFYFTGYVRPDPNASLLGALRWETVAYALNLIGSGPAFAVPRASLLVGLLGVASFVALLLLGHPRKNLPLFLFLLFIVGSIAANALGRAGLGGPNYALQSPRYQFFSCVFWAVNYLAWSECLPMGRRRPIALGTAVLASLVFSISSFTIYHEEVERVSQRLKRGMLAWTTHGRGLVYPDPDRASAILTTAIESGVYVVPIDALMRSTPLEAAPREAPPTPDRPH